MVRLTAILLIGALGCGAAHAAATAAAPTRETFPRPAQLEPAVSFWRKIFAEYSEYQLVIHSMDYPQKIYAVLDYRDDLARGEDENSIRRRQREDERKAEAKIAALLREVHAKRKTPEKLSGNARKLYELFADIDDPDVYKSQADRIRTQRGLRERTERAMAVSGRYLPTMESVFKSYRLPPQLTRLPIVESSFNLDAYSKVGAAGIWQFMPSTAKVYMRLDEIVDDRRDPWFSTDAAARHLRDDYALLKQWPLAVTAYNYGRVGVARALESVKGDSLEDLLERFDGPRFGFASRNFYAEFLAALDVDQDRDKYFKDVSPDAQLQFDTLVTTNYVPYETLRRTAGVDADTFRRLNPSFRDEVVDGKLYVPPRHEIRVPHGRGEAFKLAYTGLGSGQVYTRQRAYWIEHKVARGETLGGIAHRYGSDVRAIQQANAISNPRYIRIGQVIKVPPRDGAVPGRAPSLQTAVLQHRVERGETLAQIARRYGTSVSRLQQLNDISDPRRLRMGQMLKLSASDGGGLQEVAYSKPAAPAYRLHRVDSGQTLSEIGRRYGVSAARLTRYNGLSDPDAVRAGSLLKIPVR